jgi:RNA polymerase sigma-70 factor (sigma-E family)
VRRDGSERDERFEAFVRSRGDHHLRSAVLLAGDWQAGEDLLQASLLRLYRAWPRLDVSADPDAYLRQIIVNTRRSWWQVRWRREAPARLEPDESAEAGPAADFAEQYVLGQFVRQALARLPRQQRAVLVLRYCEDLPVAEVAAMLGCSDGTVKAHAHRGLRALRAELAGDDTLAASDTASPNGHGK